MAQALRDEARHLMNTYKRPAQVFVRGRGCYLYDQKGRAHLDFLGGIAVNALSPSRVVPTPGTIFHHLTTEDSPDAEPPAVMAEAALLLCQGAPRARTGRIAYSQDLLTELGVPAPR